MQHWKPMGLGLLLAVLAACTPMVYGVPQESWESMSELQQAETMRLYQERQLARQEAQAEQERLRALEREHQQAREAEQERLRRRRVETIHRGEGAYGDLLRVRLQGGEMKLSGKHRSFLPVAFKIAAGETLQLPVADAKGRKGTLQVSYDGGTLVLDGAGAGSSRAARLVYDKQWRDGKSYPGVGSRGALDLRGVEVYVEIAGDAPAAAPPPPLPIIVIQPPASPRTPAQAPPPRTAPQRPPERPGERTPQGPATPATPATPAARMKVTFHKVESGEKERVQQIVPASIVLRDGESRSVILRSRRGSEPLEVSYRDGIVLIGDGPSAARIVPEGGRGKGKTYRVETGGERPLRAEVELSADLP